MGSFIFRSKLRWDTYGGGNFFSHKIPLFSIDGFPYHNGDDVDDDNYFGDHINFVLLSHHRDKHRDRMPRVTKLFYWQQTAQQHISVISNILQTDTYLKTICF